MIHAYVNGDPAGPKYILHGWQDGVTITVEVWDTAAKGTLVHSEAFVHQGGQMVWAR